MNKIIKKIIITKIRKVMKQIITIGMKNINKRSRTRQEGDAE